MAPLANALPNFESRILNSQRDEDGLLLSVRDARCGGCGNKLSYGIAYLLCNTCLSGGMPAKSVHKTTKDKL